MADFNEPFEETSDLFNEKIVATGLDQFITITIVIDNGAKKVTTVSKANKLLKYRTGDDVTIFVNETIFEQLTEPQRHIVAEDALACLHYDSEKDKLMITKPDVIAYSGILSKFTFETWNVVRESIKTLYATEKERE
jgi:hypothetical protein|tara:strand:- start:14563 stop:14973 length:411 start_codon:yes stop_codon:yes gene_type:complete